MKRFFTLTLIALTLFASCKNQDFKDYIEQGFSKPTVSDVHFSKSNIGDGNKLYVPSEKEIEVEFTIKNRYSKELQGTLELQEDKKALFNTLPYIKELTFTKMVIAFNFKKEGEPSNTNHFLGESVPITLKIYDKKTSHFLSSQNISANCNTAPLSIPSENIHYDQDEDEYVVRLPKNQEKHEDLKKVEFYLSDKSGNKSASPKIFSIVEETEQNVVHHLKIKGDENWQLGKPQGDRTLKAIVYDRAGLKSTEGKKDSKRIFATITLVPDHDDVDLSSIKNGLKVPKIKELVDYFQTREVWEASGYSVSFISDYFEYDSQEDKLREKTSGSIEAKNEPYKVEVQLTGGGNTLTAEYEITVVEDTVAGINTRKFSITDETEYNPPTYPKLNFPNVTFEDDGPNGKKASIEVPYTGFVTKLKVYVEALGSNGKIKKNLSHEGSKTKTFDEILGANRGDPDGTKTLEFYAAASNGPATKKYTIEFVRGESVTVNVSVTNELLQSDDCKVEMSWTYGKKEVSISKTQAGASSDSFNVAKGTKVRFIITAGNGDRIKECSSSSDGHAPITIDNPKTKSFELVANENFILTVKFRAEASFKWVDIGGENSKGYQSVHVSYHLNDAIHNETYGITPQPTLEKAIKKNEECKFWIKELDQKYIVTKWEVNENEISQNGGNFKVSDDLTSLTIDHPDKDYVVKVFTTKLCKLDLEVYNSGGTEITDHNYTFEVKKGNGAVIPQSPANHCKDIMAGTQVYITAKEGTKIDYEIEKWQKSEDGGTSFDNLLLGGEKDEINFNITKDTIVRLILKKKKFKVEWNVEGGVAGFGVKFGISSNNNAPMQGEVEITTGGNFEITATHNKKYRIRAWEINGSEHTYGNAPEGVTISHNDKKLTINSVQKNYKIVLMLEVKKYTVTVEIEKPAEENKYTISAEADSTVLTNKATPPAYRYEDVEHGTLLTLRATPNGSHCVVTEWQHKPSGTPTWKHLGDNATFITSTIEGNTDFKVTLKYKPVKFTLVRKGSVSGKLEIRTSPTGTPEIALNGTPIEMGVASEQTRFYLKVEGMTPSTKIVSWKLNGNKENAKTNFLKNDGFWKGEGVQFNELLSTGDEVEVTIAPVQQINLKVQENGVKYTGSYNLVINQSESDKTNEDHILLPIKGNNGVEITKDSEDSPIYITKDTKLDFKMTGLPDGKEIGVWKKDTADLGSEFHDNASSQDIKVGKTEIEEYDACPNNPSSNSITITANIREKTVLFTFKISDYDGKITNDAKIKLSAFYDGSESNAEIVTLLGNETGGGNVPKEKKRRIKKGKNIKFKIEESAGHQYYFAEWTSFTGDKEYFRGVQFDKEVSITVSSDATINALCTENVVVHVHSLLGKDRGHGNFHKDWFGNLNSQTFGRITVGETTDGNFNGGSAGANGSGEEARYLSKISIKETENTNLNNLSIKYYYSAISPIGQGWVYWRYDFNNLGDGKEPRYNTETNNEILDKHKDNAIVKFKKLPPQCVVLHIWLYKVKET